MAERQLMRLLLVDDDGVNRYTVSKALQRVGYLVSEVSSGEAALERYDKSDFDLVLCEVDLPGMDGVRVLQGIKKVSPDAMVVLMTEQANVESAVQALRHGAHDYLIKPCSSEDIRESVERGIETARRLMRRRRLLDTIEQTVSELAREVSEAAPAEHDLESGVAKDRERLPPRGNAISLGSLSVLPGKYQIESDAGSVGLTPTEFDLLLFLAAHRSRVVSCHELVREVRGYHAEEAEAREVIRPHVSNLRRKLKRLGDIDLIVNVRGIGYRLGEISEEG
ncbi:MAG: response regulator transcription factor [Chloroflexi bacterium]|nr:response regulator transcription factor [Chloroflexota bacterium]